MINTYAKEEDLKLTILYLQKLEKQTKLKISRRKEIRISAKINKNNLQKGKKWTSSCFFLQKINKIDQPLERVSKNRTKMNQK